MVLPSCRYSSALYTLFCPVPLLSPLLLHCLSLFPSKPESPSPVLPSPGVLSDRHHDADHRCRATRTPGVGSLLFCAQVNPANQVLQLRTRGVCVLTLFGRGMLPSLESETRVENANANTGERERMKFCKRHREKEGKKSEKEVEGLPSDRRRTPTMVVSFHVGASCFLASRRCVPRFGHSCPPSRNHRETPPPLSGYLLERVNPK